MEVRKDKQNVFVFRTYTMRNIHIPVTCKTLANSCDVQNKENSKNTKVKICAHIHRNEQVKEPTKQNQQHTSDVAAVDCEWGYV